MKTIRVLAALIILCAVILNAPTAAEMVERIIAVVGDRVILSSELNNQVQMYMMQAGQENNIDPEQLAHDLLDKMVNDELILSAARDDTSVTASPDEIRFELDQHIATLAGRFPTEEAFIQQLAKEGLSKRALEKRLRPDIRDKILKGKIIDRKLAEISLSRQEAETFYNSYKDSLPEIPAKIKLAHILIRFKPSAETDSALKVLAEQAREFAIQGVSFADIADKFTAEGHAAAGGQIGYIRKADVVAEFGRAAFNLQPGSISGPVRSEFGWHIIQSHKRLADSVDVSHILFSAIPTATDSAATLNLADSLYNVLKDGANFKELAKLHSEDDASRATGGEMEEMTLDQLRAEFFAPLDNLTPGELTPPVYSQIGYHILKLIDRIQNRPMNMEQDFTLIRNFAQQEKTASLVEDWVEELRTIIYVDIRDYSLTE
ncbi:MAG: peptidylprolyl isomerase [candidate division Zixibacteria bacterium]|nr:peptidylprolyl isomerase [candidate division Zixibacteria bacterium]